MSNSLGFSLFVIAVLVFLGWFAVGTRLNVRKGDQIMRWLQGGLTLLGEKTTLRWLGSSAIELKIQKAKTPFRQVELFVVLEPRDVPFLWWFFHMRGRRDLLIVRGQLRTAPAFELEAMDTRAWSTRSLRRQAENKRWTPVTDVPQPHLAAYVLGPAGSQSPAELLSMALSPGLPFVRLSVHRDAPNLEAQWLLSDWNNTSAQRVFEALLHIAQSL